MVDNVKKVSDELSVAGQVTPEQLQQAAQEGFKSVLNLRSPTENGVPDDERQQSEAVGLEYANVPISSLEADPDQVAKALAELDTLPKPVLIHCGAGMRAGAIALIANAIEVDLTQTQVIEKAKQLELSPDQPHLKQFLQEEYPDENPSD